MSLYHTYNTLQEFLMHPCRIHRIGEIENKNSPGELYIFPGTRGSMHSFVLCMWAVYVCVPLVPSKFIWKFAKFVLYQRSFSLQSLRTLSLPIRIDRSTCIVTIAITQLLFTHTCRRTEFSIPKLPTISLDNLATKLQDTRSWNYLENWDVTNCVNESCIYFDAVSFQESFEESSMNRSRTWK